MSKCPFASMFKIDKSTKADSKNRTVQYKNLISHHFPQKNKVEGLFGPGSMHWKIYRCPAVIIGAYSALLLQVAHPAVADGVSRYSQFNKDYLGRAERTITSMIKIYFGDQKMALASAKKLHHIHNFIRGDIQVTRDGTKVNEKYCGNDAQHLCWVQATLVYTSLQVYEQINGTLTKTEKEKFYSESKKTAKIMGIPVSDYPKDYADFQIYFEDMINGEYLRVDKTTRDLAKVIFKPPYVPGWIAKLFAAGFLPFHLRTAYNLKYNNWRRKTFVILTKIVGWITYLTPAPFGFTPPYYQAHYRIAMHNGYRPKWSTQFFNYLCSFKVFKGVRI